MTTAFEVLLGHRWAIDPDWLPVLAAIAARDVEHPALLAARERRRVEGNPDTLVLDGVAILPVTGPIFPHADLLTEVSGATSVARLRRDLNAALADPQVHAVLLDMDSPGGAVTGIADLGRRLYAARDQKPIETYVRGSAASAAYWLASQTQAIHVDETALLGSIGIVAAVPVQEAPDQRGYRRIEVVSSNARYKRLDPRTDEGLAIIRDELDALEDIFIAAVARGRQISREQVLADYGQGALRVGAQAVAKGMADQVSTPEATLQRLQSLRPARAKPGTPRAVQVRRLAVRQRLSV